MPSTFEQQQYLQTAKLISLCEDVIYKLSRHLPCRELGCLATTCRYFFTIIVENDCLWKIRYLQRFPMYDEKELKWLRSIVGYCRYIHYKECWQLPWFYIYCHRRPFTYPRLYWAILQYHPVIWAHLRGQRSFYAKIVTLKHIDWSSYSSDNFPSVTTSDQFIFARISWKPYGHIFPAHRGCSHRIGLPKPRQLQLKPNEENYQPNRWKNFYLNNIQINGPWIMMDGTRNISLRVIRSFIYNINQPWYWDDKSISWTTHIYNFTIQLWQWQLTGTDAECLHHVVLRLNKNVVKSEHSIIYTHKVDHRHVLFTFESNKKYGACLYRMAIGGIPNRAYLYTTDKRNSIQWARSIEMERNSIDLLRCSDVFVTVCFKKFLIYDLWTGELLRTVEFTSQCYPSRAYGSIYKCKGADFKSPIDLDLAAVKKTDIDKKIIVANGYASCRYAKLCNWKQFIVEDYSGF
ncbi:hypothetical protein BDF19DRAFT_437942 [Syncephalis fuscata]|nr:hypothetical protein BDF19DRAFT_437942 [Syncephalis fuscata]